MHTQLAEALTKTNSVGNDPATARESSKLVRPAKAPNRPSGGYAFPQGQRTPTEARFLKPRPVDFCMPANP